MYNQTVLSFINKSQKQHFIQQMQNKNPTPQIKTTTAIYTAIPYGKNIQQ